MTKIFTDYRQFQIFILGIYSGMPLVVLYSTLFAWLKEANIDIAIITTFAIARMSYSLKFLWAPIVDQVRIPLLGKIGHRKSWMVVCAAIIAVILYIIAQSDPNKSISTLYFLTIALGVASATFDIVYDAYRIEKLEYDVQALGAANAVFGYRIGCLLAGAGAFYFADLYGWHATFIALSILYVVGILYILTTHEAEIIREKFSALSLHSWKVMTIDPFKDFFQRDKAIIILLAVIFYKLGDAMLGVVATPFYLELGFTKSQIASVVKVFGFGATILGTYLGGYLMYRVSNFKGLIIAGIAQSITNASFIWLNHMGNDTNALMIAISIENIAAGVGTAALVGYLSNLCNKQYSATQYALLSSASGLFSHTIVVYGGTLVKALGWDMYFLMTILLAVPGLMMLWYLNKYFAQKGQFQP